MNTFLLTVASPDGNIFSGECVKLDVRGVEGELAVMAGHIPFITSVLSCECKVIFEDDTEKTGHTDGGLLTVMREQVIFLSGSFVWKDGE
jgi:F-type H+-transporting ATPase subunit epsilon